MSNQKLIRKTLAISEDDMWALKFQALEAKQSLQGYLEANISMMAKHRGFAELIERNELLEIQLRKLSK